MKNKVKDLHHDYKKVYTKIARNLSSRHISNTAVSYTHLTLPTTSRV